MNATHYYQTVYFCKEMFNSFGKYGVMRSVTSLMVNSDKNIVFGLYGELFSNILIRFEWSKSILPEDQIQVSQQTFVILEKGLHLFLFRDNGPRGTWLSRVYGFQGKEEEEGMLFEMNEEHHTFIRVSN